MKFEKTPDRSAVTALSADQIAAANRFEERRARIEAERRSTAGDPAMRRRVQTKFAELVRHMAEREWQHGLATKWREPPPKPMTLEEIAAHFAANPVQLSEAAKGAA